MAEPLELTAMFVRDVQKRWNAEGAGSPNSSYRLSIEPGRRYDKVMIARAGEARSGSVFAFVDRENGDLIKAASYTAPQKNRTTGTLAVRYELSVPSSYRLAVEHADFAGAFLYEGYAARCHGTRI